jgi:ubiquinone/menaquinone biosynthesis C-methylase UbiE
VNYRFLEKYVLFSEYEHKKWVANEALKLPNSTKVLDVGAGTCRFRNYFVHCDYKSHDFAKLEKKNMGLGTEYGELDYISDILEIPVDRSSFDVILCTHVLEHVPEPVLVIKEFSRILKSGGTLLLTVPQRSGLHQVPYHFYGGYTKYWYKKFLPEFGFDIVSLDPNGGFFKHYGEAGQQFVSFLFPNHGQRKWMKKAFFPVYVFARVYALVQSILCYYLDGFDQEKGMTVSYHVKAIKK